MPADVTDAFVDRAPVDWTALLLRSRDSRERALLENLQYLESVRGPAAALEAAAPPAWPAICARGVLALAALQTLCGIGVLLFAAVASGPPVNRGPAMSMGLAFTAACVVLIAARGDRRRLFLLATFAAASSAFVRGALAGLPPNATGAFEIAFKGLFPEAFAPAAVWSFAVLFPRVRRFTTFDVFARHAATVAWGLGCLLFAANAAAAYGISAGTPLSILERDDPGNLFWHLFVLVAVSGIATIFLRARRAPLDEQRKVARFAMALAAGTAPFFMSGVARMALPGVDEWFRAIEPGGRAWFDTLVVGGLIATPILSTVAVLADRPFEGDAFAESLRERLARAGAALLVVAPLAALALTLYRLRHLEVGDALTSRAWIPLACVTSACAILLIRRSLRHRIEYGGVPRVIDRQERLAAALDRVRLARGERELAAVLRRELEAGARVDRARLFVRTVEGCFADDAGGAALPADSALVLLLHDSSRPIDLGDAGVRALLPPADHAWIDVNGVRVTAALKRRDGAIAAIVAVGPRNDGRSFDRHDRWFISGLTTAAASAWDREPGVFSAGGDAAFECPQCGWISASTPLVCGCRAGAVLAALPDRLAGKFVVERRIGAGGMGVVYLARDVALDRDVALKTLPELRDGAVARLQREARAMARLNHEGLATLYGLERWYRTPVLVVEYFAAGTLADRLAHGPFTPADAVALGQRLADALVYMHANGVLHRDLKPSNIGLTAAGAPKLLDFGLAAMIDRLDSQPMAGTPGYLPPEAYGEALPDAAFDLWALSLVLLEAILGRHPFAGASWRSDPVLLARPQLIAFFDRALAMSPARRFPTSEAFRSALARLAPSA